jgi:hypothetical protein
MRKLLVAFAMVFLASVSAGTVHAALTIRITSFDAANVQLGLSSVTTVPFVPPTTGIGAGPIALTNFSVVIATNTADSPDGFGGTAHSITVNLSYTGPVDNPATGPDESGKLVVEIFGDGYVRPGPSISTVESNASPSTSGLNANLVTMQSGVSNTNAPIPVAIGSVAGLVGLTSASGVMGQGVSSVLLPNPAISGAFALAIPFSFYQVITFDQFRNTGSGSISAGSMVHNVPEPATTGIWLAAIGGIGLMSRRRRAV